MSIEKVDYTTGFQTPVNVCDYMVSLLSQNVKTVLEPTPGIGNIVNSLKRKGYKVVAPDNYFELDKNQIFDAIVMNPPFSSKYAFGVPECMNKYGMRLGYHILTECMGMTSELVVLVPWFTISDSDVRLRFLKSYGILSITALPRATFQYARIQTVVLHLMNGYKGITDFRVFDKLNDNSQKLF